MMNANRIAPEKTRLQKHARSNSPASVGSGELKILQASAEEDPEPELLGEVEICGGIRLGSSSRASSTSPILPSYTPRMSIADAGKLPITPISILALGIFAHSTASKSRTERDETMPGLDLPFSSTTSKMAEVFCESSTTSRPERSSSVLTAPKLHHTESPRSDACYARSTSGAARTADVGACWPFYEALSAVDGKHEAWRQTVASKAEPRWKIVQPNTFLEDDGTVRLREYEHSEQRGSYPVIP
ncbi:hypothetical protein CDD83_5571 [Cordyceps sp. RAO-2017]|nr:hypothetical protein CDD83_5571 [Cordyceps sp. RAO-2017]